MLRVKLVPLQGEARELDGVQLRVYERLRNADFVDEHSAGQGLLQVDGVQRMSATAVLVLDFQYDEIDWKNKNLKSADCMQRDGVSVDHLPTRVKTALP